MQRGLASQSPFVGEVNHVWHRPTFGVAGRPIAESSFDQPAGGGVEIGMAAGTRHDAVVDAARPIDRDADEDDALGPRAPRPARIIPVDERAANPLRADGETATSVADPAFTR